MKILIKPILLFLCIFANTCFAFNLEASRLSDITKILNEVDKETLVIFDVDDVLIAPTDEFAFREPIRKKLNEELRSKYDQEKYKILFSDFFTKRTVRLVNPGIIALLDDLKQKNIPTTALTGWWTGRYGNIEAMEDLRFKGLEEVKISFIEISPFKKDMQFTDLKTEDGIPMVKNGIILTALADKGASLLAVLATEKLKFKKIIFIDDDLLQIESVEKACNNLGIEFIAIHYTEAKLIPLPKLDESKEKLRFEILEKEHVWLSDEELEMRLDR